MICDDWPIARGWVLVIVQQLGVFCNASVAAPASPFCTTRRIVIRAMKASWVYLMGCTSDHISATMLLLTSQKLGDTPSMSATFFMDLLEQLILIHAIALDTIKLGS
mmetsp:Transcript_50050/g.68095  ORF Transcript_50050/g.68095 Transcript_50050/m.68095 type:complete len:107 (-) Transcript_50050:139-459(-)